MTLTEENLTIRTVNPSDADLLCKWWNNGAVMIHVGFPNGLGTTVSKVQESIFNDSKPEATRKRFIIEKDNIPVGEMHYRDKGCGITKIGILVAETKDQGKGLGTLALAIFIDALFNICGYDKIILDASGTNKRAQHIYENKLGFTKLRVNENSWQDQLGNYQSSIDYELCKDDWTKQEALSE